MKTIVTVKHGQATYEVPYPDVYPVFDNSDKTVHLCDVSDVVTDTLELSAVVNVIFVPDSPELTS